jgi:squalene synthase HpnD
MVINPSQPALADASPALPAAGSSFYAALRILPAEQRQAMFEVYAFCRAVDDIADEGGERAERLAELARWRSDLADYYAHRSVAPRLALLAGAIARFGLAQEDFDAILDGMVMDAAADIRAPDFAMLDLYCDRVASAVGRHSVRIFGVPVAHARSLAHHLGRALQLTNVLRDIDEDAGRGRLYLPLEALRAAGIADTDPLVAVTHPNIAAACAPLLERARSHFTQAARLMDVCPRATTRSPRLMAAVYSSILHDLQSRGFAAPRKPLRVAKTRVLWAILRHGIF